MKKFFLFAAAAMLALVGCEKQKQTSLDFADVKKEAKITGQLGFWYAEPGAETNFVALSQQKIWFEVKAKEYATDAAENARKVFEATTKEDGSFEITVPMGETRIKGDLRTDIIRIEYNGKVFYFDEIKEDVMTLDLIAGNNKVNQVVVEKNLILSECSGEGKIKGKLLRDAGTVKKGDHEESGKIAAEGFTVVAHVTYKKNKTEEIVKDFTAVSNSNGEFQFTAIPAYDGDGNKVQIEVKKKDASYRKYVDNQWVETTAPYWLAKTDIDNVKVNEVSDAGKKELQKGDEEEPATMNKKVKVKGEMFVQAEVFEYGTGDESNKIISGPTKSTIKYTPELNGGAFELILTHKSGASIIYNLKVNEEGKFETEVAIYDSWALTDVGITSRVKKFANKEYYQHYYKKNYKNPSASKAESDWGAYSVQHVWQDWADKANPNNQYGSQSCEGTFEAEEQATPIPVDEFFATKVDNTLNFTMSADAKAALMGIGTDDIDKMKDKDGAGPYTIYEGGIDTY